MNDSMRAATSASIGMQSVPLSTVPVGGDIGTVSLELDRFIGSTGDRVDAALYLSAGCGPLRVDAAERLGRALLDGAARLRVELAR